MAAYVTDRYVGKEWLHGPQPADQKLDIMILGDGFTAETMDAYRQAAAAIKDALLSTDPFSSYAGVLNIQRIDVQSPGRTMGTTAASCDEPPTSAMIAVAENTLRTFWCRTRVT